MNIFLFLVFFVDLGVRTFSVQPLSVSRSVFTQLGYELSNRMVEVAGFNQPPEFPAKDFSKRQGTFKQVKQILPVNCVSSLKAEVAHAR